MPMSAARAIAIRRLATAIVVGKVQVKAGSRLIFDQACLLAIFKNIYGVIH